MISIIHRPFLYYVHLLQDRIPFSFSRWGDGELAAVFQVAGSNCDGHIYFPQMGFDLKGVLVDPAGSHFRGILPVGRRTYPEQLERLTNNYDLKWWDGKVILDANLSGNLSPMVKEFKKRKIIYVGPERLMGLDGILFSYDRFIPVPLVNAYLEIMGVISEIKGMIWDFDLILYSCGPMAKIIINEIAHEYPWITQIDLGSMMDGYIGLQTRSYHGKRDWHDLIRKNQ